MDTILTDKNGKTTFTHILSLQIYCMYFAVNYLKFKAELIDYFF